MKPNTTSDFVVRGGIKEEQELRSRKQLLPIVGAVFVAFLFLDVLTPFAFESQNAFFIVFMMNVVVGQLTLLCVWGTLVDGTFWIRLPWTILMLVVSWAALAFGVRLVDGGITSILAGVRHQPNTAEVLGLGLVWFYAFAVSYIPLKLAAWLVGWRIVREEEPLEDSKSNYQIRDMMIGTAILAVTLSIGRMLTPVGLPSWSRILEASELDRFEPLLALFIFSMVSLVVKLPCIWIALAAPHSRIRLLSTCWIAIAAALGLAEMGLLLMFLGPPGSEVWGMIIGLMVGHAAMATIMIGVLYALRCYGYRMIRRKRLPAQ